MCEFTILLEGEEVFHQWTRIRHLTGYTYLTGHTREETR